MLRTPEQALRLAEDLRAESEAVGRVVAEAREATVHGARVAPDRLTLYAFAAMLHSFYTGIEKGLLRVASQADGGAPGDAGWHRLLLEQMSRPLPGIRPAVLSPASVRLLDEYLGFRHRFRNLYAFDLDWERVRPLLEALDPVWAAVAADLRAFDEFLRALAAGPPG